MAPPGQAVFTLGERGHRGQDREQRGGDYKREEQVGGASMLPQISI